MLSEILQLCGLCLVRLFRTKVLWAGSMCADAPPLGPPPPPLRGLTDVR